MDTLITQQLLERLSSLLRSESRKLLLKHGLQPVQFEALQYLSVCNRYSDTPMAVTEFLGQTKGSVSQTLKVLEKKGFLKKETDAKDKRVTHLVVTKEGRSLINDVLPSPLLQSTRALISDDELRETNSSLRSLLNKLQEANSFKHFGQCHSCQHNIKSNSDGYLCGLTQETLRLEELELICREHEPANTPKGDITSKGPISF